ncbi:histidine phosphatase superfamily [Haematococcus lacustris]
MLLPSALLLWVLWVLRLTAVAAGSSVLLTFSIARHGARNALPKTMLLQESSSYAGPTLLPVGQRMCYNAGVAFRNRYLNSSNCQASGSCLVSPGGDSRYGLVSQGAGFHNYNSLVRASYTDRALLSAQAFFAGVFPAQPPNSSLLYLPTGQQPVPVYSEPDKDDWLIRTYNKCPAYDARLMAWFDSPQFQAKARDTAALRAAFQALAPALDCSLENWWNVYDAWNVWQTFGIGDPLPALKTSMFTQLVQLATWGEISKMSSNLTSNLLGGPLLADMLAYMDTTASAALTGTQVFPKLLHISSHYNVQLGVLAALALDTHPPALAALPWLSSKLPALASTAVFELLAPEVQAAVVGGELGQLAVRLVVQDGPEASWQMVPLPCAVTGDAAAQLAGPGACSYPAFRALATAAALPSAPSWCRACANTGAAACQTLAAQAREAAESRRADRMRDGLIAGVVLTFVFTLMLSCGTALLMHRRARWTSSEQALVARGGSQHSSSNTEGMPQTRNSTVTLKC